MQSVPSSSINNSDSRRLNGRGTIANPTCRQRHLFGDSSSPTGIDDSASPWRRSSISGCRHDWQISAMKQSVSRCPFPVGVFWIETRRNDGGFELQRKQVFESSRLNFVVTGSLSSARLYDGADRNLGQITRGRQRNTDFQLHARPCPSRSFPRFRRTPGVAGVPAARFARGSSMTYSPF